MGIEQEPPIPHADELALENGVPGLRGKNNTFVPLTTEVGVEVFSDKTSIRAEHVSRNIPAGFWGIVASIDLPTEEA